mgnify:FL=1
MLYIVGTPIGNLGEITYRAVETLKNVDVIAAEDTRRTMVLLNAYGIKKPLISYQKFNEQATKQKLTELLLSGKDVALVSDAGMPLISDPGYVLVSFLIEQGIEYTVVSGACACIDALVLSGMDTSKFCMLGFLPQKKSDREQLLAEYADIKCTLVFYSAVHDIDADLTSLYHGLGRRKVAVVRELTKLHEQVSRGYLGEEMDFARKGEFVIVVEGAPRKDFSSLTVEQHYLNVLSAGADKKEAIKIVASERKMPKSEVYAIVVNMEEKA